MVARLDTINKTMFIKNNFPIFFNSRHQGSFIVSIIILLSGFFILSLSSLVLGNFDKIYLLFALFTWLWLRLNEIIFNLLINQKINKYLAFSISWMTPITLVCLMGIFHLNLPIIILSIIGLIDFLLFMKFNYKEIFKLNWKSLTYTFVLGIIIIALTVINSSHFVWMSDLAYVGIVGDDTLRDAAIINSWSEYSSISHGIHGLLFEPYHALFAFFFDPFINESRNIFQIFVIFSNMVMPAIIVYGCSKIIINIGSEYVSKNWIFFLLFFILTFAAFDYITIQRSLFVATLLYIPIIPLVFNILNNPRSAKIEIILLCLMVPFIIFSRAFHGLFILGLLFYFLLIQKLPLKLIIISSIVFSVLFLLLFFGETERVNSSFGYGYFNFFIKSNTFFINSYLIPIIIYLIFTTFKKNLFTFKILSQINKNSFLYFIIYICILTLLLASRTGGYSDTFYQLLPIYWFSFFFLLTSNFSSSFIKSKKQRKILELLNKKALLILVLFVVSISFVQKNVKKIDSDGGALKRTIKDIRVLNNKWKDDGENHFLLNNINTESCKKEILSFVCKVRSRLLGVTNFDKFILDSSMTKLINQAKDISSELEGNTAVYISPDHKYWKYFEFNKDNRGFKPSMFFMGVGKLPLIFGAQKKTMTLAYSVKTAHKNGGTLRSLNEIGNQDDFCRIAQTVKVKNIIIFLKEEEPRILQCK
tara:strand:+ start:2204 stop:4312 length:2109 start_codon:yes stop_codon:yes gene_type:complete